MKIFVSKFVLEANENIPMFCDLQDMDICYGENCVERMQLKIPHESKIELIPGIYADAASSGVMKKNAFEYIKQYILKSIEKNIHDIDGIYLHLHGASKVEGVGSGDHEILRAIRKMVGPYLPIAITCDPHGNLNKEYVENTTLIRSYRESPHTDIEETIDFVFSHLVQLIDNRENITPVYRKLPLILGGEQSVSLDEPVKSINEMLDSIEEDEKIMSASWHVGYIRHDTPDAGCGIVIVPAKPEYRAFAEEVATRLEEFIWDRRHEFHYTGLTDNPEKALQKAIDFDGAPVFITDSGDNVTSGSIGANTFVLQQVLNRKNRNQKKFLFAAIHDKEAYKLLLSHEIGEIVKLEIGMDYDELTAKVPLEVEIKAKGRQSGTKIFGEFGDFGGCITVSLIDEQIDIIVTDTNHPFVEKHQFETANVDWEDYDIIIVKIGYAFPELKEAGALCIMSLTKGATLQDTAALPFKLIKRPMFPIDKI